MLNPQRIAIISKLEKPYIDGCARKRLPKPFFSLRTELKLKCQRFSQIIYTEKRV